jgi:hypothetical protein
MPSIQLRLLGMTGGDEALAHAREANDGGFPLYDSFTQMCEANGATSPRYKSDDDEPDGWDEEK